MNGILTALHLQAAALLDTWLIMQLQTGAFVLLVLAIDSLLRNATPRTRYLLWMTALVKAFIPPVLALPGGAPVPALERITLPVIEAGSGVLAADTSAGIPAFSLLVAALLLCAAALTVVVLFRSIMLRLRLRDAAPFAHDAWQSGPPVFVSRRISSPLAFGMRHPRIFVTPELAVGPARILHAVLYHERAHIRRRDQVTVYLQTLIQVFSVLNPLVWLMNTRLFRYREQICDAEALERTGARPQDYGRLLLDFAAAHPARIVQVGTCFFETRRGFVQRINHLFAVQRKRTPRWSQRIAVGVSILLIVPLSWQCSNDGQESLVPPVGERTELRGEQQGEQPADVPPADFVHAADVPAEIAGGLSALRARISYPEQAVKEELEGIVIIEVEVKADGQIGTLDILKSAHPLLDKAALEAVAGLTFIPARSEDVAVRSNISIPIKYRLK